MERAQIRLRSSRHHLTGHRRGIALLLVLIVLAMTVILALSFLAAQSTSIGISQNIKRQAQARMIAESGLNLGIAQIKADPSWRSNRTSGVWATNQSYQGGTFTLKGEDGTYNAATGQVVGDGSLSNNNTDLVTLTAIGTYQGVTHTSHVQITPGTTSGAFAPLLTSGAISWDSSNFVDSWDSTLGDYGGANKGSNGVLQTNSVASQIVQITSGTIKGKICCGVGGNPAVVVKVQGGSVTGTVTAAASAAPLPTVSVPAGLPGSSGNLTISSPTTISTNAHYNNLTLNGATVHISGNISIVVDGSLSSVNAVKVYLDAGSTLKMYLKNGATIDNSSLWNMDAANNTGGLSKNLIFYNLGSGAGGTVSIIQSAQVDGIIVSPNAPVNMTNSAMVFGAILCQSYSSVQSVQVHQDTSLTYASLGSAVDGVGLPATSTKVVWVDQP